jgi:hypothetical protein
MGKPDFSVYQKFRKRYFELTKSFGKEQYLVPYLMSSHPGSTLADALELALCLKRDGYAPEQVQDYYPTPGTASTVMYYTGINPLTGKRVYVATDYHEKQLQRALLQFNRPQNADAVREALTRAGREDLIGNAPHCLVRPVQTRGEGARHGKGATRSEQQKKGARGGAKPPLKGAKNGKKAPVRGAKQGQSATAPARKTTKRTDKRR